MNRRGASTFLALGLVVAVLAGCGPVELPVQAEVEWEGKNTSALEKDPRVEVVREFVVQAYAADNAFNYSDGALLEVATNPAALSLARSTASSIRQSPIDSPVLWEGPPSFAVVDVVQRKRQDRVFDVNVCQRPAPHWTLAAGDTFEKGEIQERDGAYRIEQDHFVEHHYTVWESDDGDCPRNG